MNVLFDTNVILDVLLAREPYVEAARSAHASAIVTRDQVDFANSEIPVLTPRELLAAIAASTRDSSAST